MTRREYGPEGRNLLPPLSSLYANLRAPSEDQHEVIHR